MADRYRIRATARADLKDIWRYIASDNERAAGNLIDRITSRFEMLADFPLAGRQRSDLAPGLRSFSLEPVTIFYFADFGIEVVRVIRGGQDITEDDFK